MITVSNLNFNIITTMIIMEKGVMTCVGIWEVFLIMSPFIYDGSGFLYTNSQQLPPSQ